jgi:hypothetical protein
MVNPAYPIAKYPASLHYYPDRRPFVHLMKAL